MPRASNATDEDWAAVRKHWASGFGFGACSKLVDGRAAASTIRRRALNEGWIRESGEPVERSLEERRAMTAAAVEATKRRWADEKDRVIDRLVGLVDTLVDEVTAPHEMIDVKVVGGGKDAAASIETVRTWIPSPVPADKQRLVTSAAIVIDKLQLLTGEATSRNENLSGADRSAVVQRTKQMRDELQERRQAKEIGGTEAATG